MARIEIEVPLRVLKDYKEKKYIEIFTRNAKKKFKECIKVTEAIIKNEKSDINVEKQLTQVKKMVKNLTVMNNQMKDMAIDVNKILSGVGTLTNLSYLNIGLSMVNVGISVAGFAMMSQKLDDISEKLDELKVELDEIKETVQEIKDLQLEEYIFTPRASLISETKMICRDEQKNRNVSEMRIVELLKRYRLYLNKLLNLYKLWQSETILDILFELLPIFKNLIVLYYEKYYDVEGKDLHVLHSEWMDIFYEMVGSEFSESLRDYYFIEKRRNSSEVNDIIVGVRLLVANYITSITDTIDMLEISGGSKEYLEIKKEMQKIAHNQANKYMDDLMNEGNITEEQYNACKDEIHKSFGMAM